MTQSTITDRFQTTIPLGVREALKLKPRQRVSYEVRPDGSAIIRPVPPLDELFASIKLGQPVAGAREEKAAARSAIAREAFRKSLNECHPLPGRYQRPAPLSFGRTCRPGRRRPKTVDAGGRRGGSP